jgi:hypothetical protein
MNEDDFHAPSAETLATVLKVLDLEPQRAARVEAVARLAEQHIESCSICKPVMAAAGRLKMIPETRLLCSTGREAMKLLGSMAMAAAE